MRLFQSLCDVVIVTLKVRYVTGNHNLYVYKKVRRAHLPLFCDGSIPQNDFRDFITAPTLSREYKLNVSKADNFGKRKKCPLVEMSAYEKGFFKRTNKMK